MTLRRTFLIAFATVAVAVAVLVGVLSYQATARNLAIEVDQSLTAAATTVGSGGVLALPPAVNGAPDDDPGEHRPGSGPDDDDHEPRGRSLLLVQTAQRVAPDGRVTVLLGSGLPVTATDVALAAADGSGARHFRTQTVGTTTYRVLTQSVVDGAVTVARDLRETDAVLAGLAAQITAAGLGVLVLAAAAGWLLARRITRRLLHLTEAAELISATGRLDVAMTASGRDEVGRLGTALATMLGELARSRDDQQRLVQDAGHELRTPLTSLRTNLSVLRRFEELAPSSRRRLLDDLDVEARELTTLVNELIELAIDRRATEQPQPVDLAELAERVVQRFRRRTGRTITVNAAAEAGIEGRPQALERALSNLVDNAVKFDPGGDRPVEVEVGPDRVQVLDRGPGIDPADTSHVFERFYRAPAARALTGSGLGLAIVREIAELHGGSVFARARDGGGAIVGFTLAAAPERAVS